MNGGARYVEHKDCSRDRRPALAAWPEWRSRRRIDTPCRCRAVSPSPTSGDTKIGRSVAVSHNGDKLATILGNPALIEAYKSGIPGNGKPFPDGARFAKIHWTVKKDESQPGEPLVPGPLHDVDFMVKDSKKFADSGGWGYAQFDYDTASESFKPGDENSTPPQEHDAKCGFACHTIVADKDYVFTAYPKR